MREVEFIEWAGRLPADWRHGKLRWLASIYAGGTPSKNVAEYWERGEIPWINSGAVNQISVTEPSAYISVSALQNSSAKWIPRGALVIALAGQGKTKGMVAHLAIATTCNQSMAAIVPHDARLARFFYWWLESNYQNIRNLTGGDLRDGLNLELLGSIDCPLPKPEIGEAVSRLLDSETAKIDELISKQHKLIELLKEKRQAVISHAVTKGLNPDAPMRDSGVEWLGEIPRHWEVKRLKQVSELQSGLAKGKEANGLTVTVPMLRVANVQDGFIDLTEVHEIEIEKSLLNRYSLRPGDLLMNEGGDNDKLGRGAIWQGDIEPCIHQNHVFAIRVKDVEPEWIAALTRSHATKFHFYRHANQSTNLASISSTNIMETPVLIPPREERQSILEHLAKENTRVNLLENLSRQQIELLAERRNALISAAVTGKIDVRDSQSSNHAMADASD